MATMHYYGKVSLIDNQRDITPMQKLFLGITNNELIARERNSYGKDDSSNTLKDKFNQRKNYGSNRN